MNIKDLVVVIDNINIDDYIYFRESVKANMEHPEWLGEIPKEGLQEMVLRYGYII